jgi:hypothetical protein
MYDRSGRVLGSRQVSTGGGYNTQHAAPLHFGVAGNAAVDVEVTFMTPSGRRTQRVNRVDPARYHGRSLVIRQSD